MSWKENLKVFGIPAACALLIFGGMGYLIYSTYPRDADRPAPKWDNGTLVQSVLSGQKGMIITLRCWAGESACYYDVRFSGLQMTTNTRLLGADDSITNEPLMVVAGMREYELEDVK